MFLNFYFYKYVSEIFLNLIYVLKIEQILVHTEHLFPTLLVFQFQYRPTLVGSGAVVDTFNFFYICYYFFLFSKAGIPVIPSF
jgi:hypothetical protein